MYAKLFPLDSMAVNVVVLINLFLFLYFTECNTFVPEAFSGYSTKILLISLANELWAVYYFHYKLKYNYMWSYIANCFINQLSLSLKRQLIKSETSLCSLMHFNNQRSYSISLFSSFPLGTRCKNLKLYFLCWLILM